jgi:hypothetical protein
MEWRFLMSAYDFEVENRTRTLVHNALGIINHLVNEQNLKIDDNAKAQLIGQLVVAASIEGLVVYANKIGKNFAFEFFQEMINSGVAPSIANIPAARSEKKVKSKESN